MTTCTKCGRSGHYDLCPRCGRATAEGMDAALLLNNARKSAWLISLLFWGVFVALVVGIDRGGNLVVHFRPDGGSSALFAGCVFGGLVQAMILWTMANKGSPYAGAMWGFYAGTVVAILWWVLPIMFATANY